MQIIRKEMYQVQLSNRNPQKDDPEVNSKRKGLVNFQQMLLADFFFFLKRMKTNICGDTRSFSLESKDTCGTLLAR